MPTDETMVTPEVVTEQPTPAEMFLQDLNSAEAEAPMEEVGGEGNPEVLAAEEAMGMPAAEAAPDAEYVPGQEAVPAEAPAPQDDEVQNLRNTVSALLDIVKRTQAEKAAMSQEEQAAEDAPAIAVVEEEEEPFDEEAFNEEFYANPSAMIRNLAEKIANKNVQERLAGLESELAPLLEESKAAQHRESVKKTLSEFLDSTPDANDYFEDIARYVQENGLATDDPQSYRDAYLNSKMSAQADLINQLQQANAEGSRSLNDYLNDDESVAQIIANDNVKTKVIENYLKELQEGSRPITISSGGSAQIPGSAAMKADSMDDAGRMFLESLKR